MSIFSIFKKFFGKNENKENNVQVDSIRVDESKGIVFIRTLGCTHTFEVENCFFSDRNSGFNIETGKLKINPVSFDSDVIYFAYEKKMHDRNGYANSRFPIDNSEKYKKHNQMMVDEFKAKKDVFLVAKAAKEAAV